MDFRYLQYLWEHPITLTFEEFNEWTELEEQWYSEQRTKLARLVQIHHQARNRRKYPTADFTWTRCQSSTGTTKEMKQAAE
jgi:uncharacterized HAD superfamily protein